jgi:hypothetical protein
MTKNARAKKDTRARMETTGENYTTASRAVAPNTHGRAALVIATDTGGAPIHWNTLDGNLSIVGAPGRGKSNAARSIILSAIEAGYDAAVLDLREGQSEHEGLGADVVSRSSHVATWLRDIEMAERRMKPLLLVVENAHQFSPAEGPFAESRFEKAALEHLVRVNKTARSSRICLVFVTRGSLDARLHDSCASQLTFAQEFGFVEENMSFDKEAGLDLSRERFEANYEVRGKPTVVAKFGHVPSRAAQSTSPSPMSIDIVCGPSGGGKSTEALSIEKFYREREGYSATRWVTAPSEFEAPDEVGVLDSHRVPLSEVFAGMDGGVLVVDELRTHTDVDTILSARRNGATHVIVVIGADTPEVAKKHLELMTSDGTKNPRQMRLLDELVYTVTLVKDQGASRESFYWGDIDIS